MFFGLITKDHLVHITAVDSNDKFCAPLTLSTGLLMSVNPAITRPHFKVGAQKCTVLGPVSLCQNRLKAIFIVDILYQVVIKLKKSGL